MLVERSKKQFLFTKHFLAPPGSISFSYWTGRPQIKRPSQELELREVGKEPQWGVMLKGGSLSQAAHSTCDNTRPKQKQSFRVSEVAVMGLPRWGSDCSQAEARMRAHSLNGWLPSQWGRETRPERGDVVFLLWIPAGFICGSFQPEESSCPSCFGPIFCIFLPVSSVWLLASTRLLQLDSRSTPFSSCLRGQAHWDAFVKSETLRSLQRRWSQTQGQQKLFSL